METRRIKDTQRKEVKRFCDGLQDNREAWTKGILEPVIKNIGLCAVDKGRIIGVVYVFLNKNFPMTTGTVGIVISNSERGKGIGQKLLSEVEKVALEENLNKLRAQVRTTNPKSTWLFIKAGYRIVEYQESKVKNVYILEKSI